MPCCVEKCQKMRRSDLTILDDRLTELDASFTAGHVKS